MAIDYTKPADPKHIVYDSLDISVTNKVVTLRFIDEDNDIVTFNTRPAQWSAVLSFLFDNLTNAAELKGRVENYLIANEIPDGVKVAD
jgi:hypothetical protein